MKSPVPDPSHQRFAGNILGRAYLRFLKIRGGSREIALGLALGVFVGMTPFMGFQTPIAIFFAAMCKWSKISAALGVWISNPFSAPFIYPITYYVGVKLLGASQIPPLPDELTFDAVIGLLKSSPTIILDLLVGGMVLGLPLAFITYGFSYSAISGYRKKLKPRLKRRNHKNGARKKRRKKKKKRKNNRKGAR